MFYSEKYLIPLSLLFSYLTRDNHHILRVTDGRHGRLGDEQSRRRLLWIGSTLDKPMF